MHDADVETGAPLGHMNDHSKTNGASKVAAALLAVGLLVCLGLAATTAQKTPGTLQAQQTQLAWTPATKLEVTDGKTVPCDVSKKGICLGSNLAAVPGATLDECKAACVNYVPKTSGRNKGLACKAAEYGDDKQCTLSAYASEEECPPNPRSGKKQWVTALWNPAEQAFTGSAVGTHVIACPVKEQGKFWEHRSDGSLTIDGGITCLDWTSNGMTAYMNACNPGLPHQKWKFTDDKHLMNLSGSYRLDWTAYGTHRVYMNTAGATDSRGNPTRHQFWDLTSERITSEGNDGGHWCLTPIFGNGFTPVEMRECA